MREQEIVAAYVGICPECGSAFCKANDECVLRKPMFLADIAAIHQMFEPRTAKRVIDRALEKMREQLLASG